MLGSSPAHGPEGGHVWEALPSPLLCPHTAENEPEAEQAQATGEYFIFAGQREKVEGLCSECTSPLFSGTYVSIRDTDIRLAIKKIKQDTNSAHNCLQPELPILFQSRKGGVDYVGLKVWPRSFLCRPTSLRWVEMSLTSMHQNSTLPPCPISPPS